MKFTRITLITLLAALLAFAGTANAQVNTTTYCGDLSESDCALLQEAWAAAPSATFEGEGALEVTLDGTPFAATLGMNGRYITDQTLVERFAGLTEAGPEALEMMYSDPASFVTFITDFFQIVDSSMTLDVSLPAALMGEMAPAEYSLDLWLVDGVAYADLAAFSALDPSLTGVYGIDLVGLYTDLFNQPETAEALGMMFSNDSAFSEDMAAFADPSFAAEFTTLERLDDATVNGTDVAVFQTTVDYGALFSSDLLREAIEAQVETQREMMAQQGADPAALEALNADAVLGLYEAIFADTTMITQTAVGMEDGYTYQTTVMLDMSFDPETLEAAMAELSGETGAPAPQGIPPVTVDFDFIVTQSAFGAIDEVAAPADAEVLPPSFFGLPAPAAT